MSEEKRHVVYPADSDIAQAAQTLLREKEAREDNKLPMGRTKEFLVDEGFISNVSIKNLSAEEANMYYYVCTIVNKRRKTVAKKCSTRRKSVNERTRLRGKSDSKKRLKAPGVDMGGIC